MDIYLYFNMFLSQKNPQISKNKTDENHLDYHHHPPKGCGSTSQHLWSSSHHSHWDLLQGTKNWQMLHQNLRLLKPSSKLTWRLLGSFTIFNREYIESIRIHFPASHVGENLRWFFFRPKLDNHRTCQVPETYMSCHGKRLLCTRNQKIPSIHQLSSQGSGLLAHLLHKQRPVAP